MNHENANTYSIERETQINNSLSFICKEIEMWSLFQSNWNKNYIWLKWMSFMYVSGWECDNQTNSSKTNVEKKSEKDKAHNNPIFTCKTTNKQIVTQ
jgi:hypothetical protein